jgi:hypothetical protein
MPIAAIFAAVAPEVFATEAITTEAAAAEAAARAAAEQAAAEAAAKAAAEAAAQQAATQAATQTATSQAGIAGVPQTVSPYFGTATDAAGQPLGFNAPPAPAIDAARGITAAPPVEPTSALNSPMGELPQSPKYQLNAPNASGGLRMGAGLEGLPAPTSPTAMYTPYEPSALEKGLDSASKWAKENPFQATATAYMGANALGLLNPSGATFNNAPYSGPLSKYRLSDDFQAGSANPEDYQYTPKRYASGGVMGADPYSIPVGYDEGGTPLDAQNYAAGGSLTDSIEQYQKMLGGQRPAAPAASHDVGIYYDQDPDTRYQDALTAAQIRQAKVNQRAYVSPPVAKRPTPMGQLRMASVKPRKQGDSGGDVEAARGGIMQAYADGGVTGSGNLDLHIPLDLGGGGGGGGGGYTPAGGGNVNPNTGGGGFGGLMQGLAGLFGSSGGFPSQAQAGNYGDQTLVPLGGFNGQPDLQRLDTFSHGPNPYYGQQQGLQLQGGRSNDVVETNDRPLPKQSYDDILAGRSNMASGGTGQNGQYFAQGGDVQSTLGGYAAGGNPRLLKGPGDGMSDNIPATINGRQPARLADGEFVIPADVVSHLGNGSTDAGAKQLHAMMDKVRKARTGNPKQGKEINAQKYIPK